MSDTVTPPPATDRRPPSNATEWSDLGVFDAIFSPRATRIYADRPVPDHLLARILRAGTFACSAGNTQPWELVVVTDRELKKQLQAKLAEAFAGIDAQRAQTKEQLIDGAGRSVTGHAAIENIDVVGAIVFVFWNPDRGIRLQNEYAENPDGTLRPTRPMLGGRGSSLFQACQNMILGAQALGVSSLFTTFFGLIEPGVKELLGVPPRFFLESAVFLGYGAEDLKQPRRLPLPEVAHLDHYGTPFDAPLDPAGS
jgi:nitroreductase